MIAREIDPTANPGSQTRRRVAIVSEPGLAGVKRHVVDLLNHLDLTRFEVTYYYSLQRREANYPQEIGALEERGITCLEVPMATRGYLRENLRAFFKLITCFRRQRPEVLHLHSSMAGGLGRLASLFVHPRPKVLYTPHAMACYRSGFYLWLERFLGLFTDVLIAVSESERLDFIRWHIPKGRQAAVIPLGLPPPAQPESGVKISKAGEPWLIGACGRICAQKNALLFFQLAQEAIAKGRDWRFCWIGDYGDDQEARMVKSLLEKTVQRDRIQISGWISNPGERLALLDVFCMFSRYESFGYVTAEAMLLGVPVLATPATGTNDLVRHEVTGLLTEPEVGALLASLERLQEDSTLRARLAANAQRFIAEKHTIAEMAAATEQLYSLPLSK